MRKNVILNEVNEYRICHSAQLAIWHSHAKRRISAQEEKRKRFFIPLRFIQNDRGGEMRCIQNEKGKRFFIALRFIENDRGARTISNDRGAYATCRMKKKKRFFIALRFIENDRGGEIRCI